MYRAPHLHIDEGQIRGATLALLPGDPFRVPKIAEEIKRQYRGEIAEIAWNREYRSFLCAVHERPVLVISTGIGGPSASIVIEELALLGVSTFIRIGTTGALQEDIRTGDVIITAGSVRLDGASTHYAPIEYPAVAHHEIVNALKESAKENKVRYHVGVSASTDTFYAGQERYDSFAKYVIRRFQGSMKEWQRLHVLNYEMESSTILTLTSALGLRGGCVTGVVVNRTAQEHVTEDDFRSGEDHAVKVAVAALDLLV